MKAWRRSATCNEPPGPAAPVVLSFTIYAGSFESISGDWTFSGAEPPMWQIEYDDNVGFWSYLFDPLGGSSSFSDLGSFPGGTVVKCRIQARDLVGNPLSDWLESNTLNL